MRLCPWLRKCVGDRILVDRGTLAIWYSALLTYVFDDIDVRLAELAGVPQYSRAFRDDMQAHVIGGDRN